MYRKHVLLKGLDWMKSVNLQIKSRSLLLKKYAVFMRLYIDAVH